MFFAHVDNTSQLLLDSLLRSLVVFGERWGATKAFWTGKGQVGLTRGESSCSREKYGLVGKF